MGELAVEGLVGREGGREEGRLENWIGRVWQERGGEWELGELENLTYREGGWTGERKG